MTKAEVNRPSGIRVRFDESVFTLANPVGPAPAPLRAGLREGPAPGLPDGLSAHTQGILAGMSAAGFTQVDVLDWQGRVGPAFGRGGAGAAGSSLEPLELEMEVPADQHAVVLLEQDGFYSWVAPSDAAPVAPSPGRKRSAPPPGRRLRFTLNIAHERPSAGAAKRGFIGEFLVGKVLAWVFTFVAREGLQLGVKLLERHVKEGPVIINSAEDPHAWTTQADLGKVKLPQDRAPRILLLVHGTFSSTLGAFSMLCATPWGRSFLSAALSHYDLVLGFDHRTLGEDPLANADDILEALGRLEARIPPRIDGIAHSRGCLVLRSLVEAVLPVSEPWHAESGACIFVAGTHDGTSLANPDNWRTLVDLYTNLASATAGLLSGFPGTAAAGLVLKETVSTLGALVKALVSGACGPDGVPGLSALVPGGHFVGEINKTQPRQKGPMESFYYVVESDFHVDLLGGAGHEPREFSRRLALLLAENFIGPLLPEPNDLVVPDRSMTAIDLTAGDFIKDKLDFGRNSAVYHTNYFARPEVADALVHWLGLPAPGQDKVAESGTMAMPDLGAAVNTGILVLDASVSGAEGATAIRETVPSYVVVRRPYMGRTLHYAYRPEDLVDRLDPTRLQTPLERLLDLHEGDSWPELRIGEELKPTSGAGQTGLRGIVMAAGRPVGVLPGPASPMPGMTLADLAQAAPAPGRAEGPFALRRAMPSFPGPGAYGFTLAAPPLMREIPQQVDLQPLPEKPPVFDCNFQAAMDQEVALGTIVTLDVEISRETLAAIQGRATAKEPVQLDPGAKVLVHVAPKLNFVNVGTSRIEVDPKTDLPALLSFDVAATDLGKGEVWVVVRQGVKPVTILKLFPEVTAMPAKARPRQQVASTQVLAPGEDRLDNVLLVLEQVNGNEMRLRYDLISKALGIVDLYESQPILGDRDAYVQEIYKEIETAWNSNPEDAKAFQEDLRAVGAQMFTTLFPPRLQQALWDHREKLDGIMVISEEPFIPWELVHLKEPGQALGQESRFLAELGLVRWIHGCGHPPGLVQVREGRARYLIPDYLEPNLALPSAQEEGRILQEVFGATAIEPQPNPAREALRGPDPFDLFHFAGHGEAENGNIAHAQLLLQGRMEGGGFKRVFLNATTVEAFANLGSAGAKSNRPMVVLNACQVGRTGFALTRIGGFATAFLSRGAGIFVAPLWSVPDRAAVDFVATLYEWLVKGDSLAKAAAKARQAIRKPGDATWLAYSIYGNPEARMEAPCAGTASASADASRSGPRT